MQPHEERVVVEKDELDAKIKKLEAFIGGDVFSSLAEDEQERLRAQVEAMDKYSSILGDRIAAF
jgi:hypothetical protein